MCAAIYRMEFFFFLFFSLNFFRCEIDTETEYSSEIAQPGIGIFQGRPIVLTDAKYSGHPAVHPKRIGGHSNAFTFDYGQFFFPILHPSIQQNNNFLIFSFAFLEPK